MKNLTAFELNTVSGNGYCHHTIVLNKQINITLEDQHLTNLDDYTNTININDRSNYKYTTILAIQSCADNFVKNLNFLIKPEDDNQRKLAILDICNMAQRGCILQALQQ